jgi:hypothetical protein
MYAGKHDEGPEAVFRSEAGAEALLRERITTTWAEDQVEGEMPDDLSEAATELGFAGHHYWIETLELQD